MIFWTRRLKKEREWEWWYEEKLGGVRQHWHTLEQQGRMVLLRQKKSVMLLGRMKTWGVEKYIEQ